MSGDVRIEDRSAIADALRQLADGIDLGDVVAWSGHQEPTGIARLSVVYAAGAEGELPGVPVADDADSTPTPTMRPKGRQMRDR